MHMSKQKLTNSHKTCGMFKREIELHFNISSLFTVLITVQQYVYDSPLQATERIFLQLSFLKPHCHISVSLPVQLKCQVFVLTDSVAHLWSALPQLRLSHNLLDIPSSHWDAQTCSLFMSTSPVQLFESKIFGGLPGEE